MSGSVTLHRFDDPEALARVAAQRWLDPAVPHLRNVALSGGRIARGFLAAAASLATDSVDSARMIQEKVFFWADERCVPPGDPESNFRLAKELLFDPLSLSPSGIHRIKGELNPPDAARDANNVIARVLPSDAGGLPVFDLVFLGMGEDGHIASLFEPGSGGGSGKAPYQVVTGPKPPNPRVTLTFPVLAAARHVWVLVSGAGKEPILRKSLQGKVLTPLAHLIQLRESTVLFVDDSFFEHPRA